MSTKKLKVSEGDWLCSIAECGNLNFARRDKCNKCGEPKSAKSIIKSTGHEIGEKFAEKSHGLFSANDWQCAKCSNINWARRNTCNVCNAPKVGPDEKRTGYGGGFKENENITYKEKEDSDGEFDEFGRKKKKYRGKVPDVKTVVDTPPVTKSYDNEEEEDDDDDDDVDLSKYALSSDDDDTNPPPEPKILKRKSPITNNTAKRSRSRSRSSSSSSSNSSSSSSSRSRSRSSHKHTRSRSRSPRKRSRSRSRSPRRRSRSPRQRYQRSRSRSPRRRSRSPHRSRR